MDGPNVRIKREELPSGLDPTDAGAVREWIRTVVEGEVSTQGGATPQLLILFDDKVISAPLGAVFEAGQEAIAAAYWHAMGEMEGARRRLRVGVVLLSGEGAARRAAFAMEWEPHLDRALFGAEPGTPLPAGLPGFGARWWLAYRFFGHGDGGTGVLHGDWVEREGVGFEGLDEPFRELLDAERVVVTLTHGEWELKPALDLQTEWILRQGGPKPTSAVGFAQEVAGLTDPEVLANGLDGLWAFAFRDDWVEWWRIRGNAPCSLDDLLRNVAQFSAAEAIGVVFTNAVQVPDGSTKRAVTTTVEHAGVRSQRALVLQFGDDGSVSVAGVLTQQPGEVPPEHRWLGVAPGHDLRITTNGMVRKGPGPELPEG